MLKWINKQRVTWKNVNSSLKKTCFRLLLWICSVCLGLLQTYLEDHPVPPQTFLEDHPALPQTSGRLRPLQDLSPRLLQVWPGRIMSEQIEIMDFLRKKGGLNVDVCSLINGNTQYPHLLKRVFFLLFKQGIVKFVKYFLFSIIGVCPQWSYFFGFDRVRN